VEEMVISNLMTNDEYARKVVPHLLPDYFSERHEQILVREVIDFFEKFNDLPTKDTISLSLSTKKGVSEKILEDSLKLIQNLPEQSKNLPWAIEETEKFCKKRSVYNAIVTSVKIIDGEDKNMTQDAIPKLLQDALAVSFDSDTGHDYFLDAEERWETYVRVDEKIPFDLNKLNLITRGGLGPKTLSVLLAESGGGKSIALCHFAASWLRQGKNVLYFTLELAEEKVSERIDANLFNLEINKIVDLGKENFLSKVDTIAAKTHGRLFVKEYPPSAAHAGHFRGHIEELKTKKNFIPDVIVVDYLGICASSRLKMGGSVNSYAYLKSVSEELRGLAIEFKCPLVTAQQVTRGAYNTSDFDLDSISDSMGIVHTADLILALIKSEELDELGQLMIKQLKNRFNDLSFNRKFVVGLNKAKMKMFDLEEIAQTAISQAPMPTKKSEPIDWSNKKPEKSAKLNF
jgi:replicative DNA helicase